MMSAEMFYERILTLVHCSCKIGGFLLALTQNSGLSPGWRAIKQKGSAAVRLTP